MQVTFRARSAASTLFPADSPDAHAELPALAGSSAKARRREVCWTTLIETEALAQIELLEVDDEHAHEVAELCLTHACAHDVSVTRVLLLNSNVRREALELLQSHAPSEPGAQKALAHCYFKSGYRLSKVNLAPEVLAMIEQREEADDAHWAAKRDKHGLYGPDGEHLRTPYFYAGDGASRSLVDRNCELLSPGGEAFECRHLQQAAAGSAQLPTKQYLSEVSVGNVTSLNYQALDNAYKDKTTKLSTINFTHNNFGALMRRLCVTLVPGQSQSFYVGWLAEDSHAMRVFLEKRTDGRIQVGFYDPSVTGNIHHLSVLPEQLADLALADFITEQSGTIPEVLALAIDNRPLSRACAGQFVDIDPTAQFLSLCQALANGSVPEMERSIANLGPQPWAFKQEVVAQLLATSFHHTLMNGHAPAVSRFMEFLAQPNGFSGTQLAHILAACSEQTSGLHFALQLDQTAAVQKFLAGLKQLDLSAEHRLNVALGLDKHATPGAYFARRLGHTRTITAYMAQLRGLFKTSHQVQDLADRLALELAPEHSAAGMNGDAVAAAVAEGLRHLRNDAGRLALVEIEEARARQDCGNESEEQAVVIYA